MAANRLRVQEQPTLTDGRMILAFSGWMDGGDVSTGTVEWLTKMLDARAVARIAPEDFYIYNFPGTMELCDVLRPHAKVEDGLVTAFDPPANVFSCAGESRLVLFSGREPNFAWDDFADCLFDFAARSSVTTMYFVGSFGGTVPHTRDPRLFASVSEEGLKPALAEFGLRFANYEGPASLATQLIHQAHRRGVRMASLVAEIPAYIQGPNPKCIEAVVRKLAAILGLQLPLGDLRHLGPAWEERLTKVLAKKTDLAKYIRKLEEDYDNEVFDTQMGDLKEWLEQQGIRVD